MQLYNCYHITLDLLHNTRQFNMKSNNEYIINHYIHII